MQKSILKCAECTKEFEKPTKEVTRQAKAGRHHFFCSQSCASIYGNRNASSEVKEARVKRIREQTPHNYGNQYAQRYKFGWVLHTIHKRHHVCDVDDDYLTELWEAQQGKCALTSLDMILDQSWSKRIRSPFQASLDRKDSSKGYVRGNVQFVAYSANLAKNNFTDDQIAEFFSQLRKP